MKQEEKQVQKEYDKLAEHYHYWRTEKNPEGWHYNELLEMPTTLKLLGNVKGKRILDFGCGTGIYAKLLTKKGAIIKGFDISPSMLKIAKELNPKLDLRIGSGSKIPFNEKFDIILSSLVVHYIEDWDKMFKEVSRVLKDNGYFIFSSGNPISEMAKKVSCGKKKYKVLGLRSYFQEKKISTIWNVDDGIRKFKAKIFFYHKTYETIIKSIIKNGFEIADYKDCFPLKKAKKLFPKEYNYTSKVPFFCVWKVKKRARIN
jgi:SAM-dependent methyltransferase